MNDLTESIGGLVKEIHDETGLFVTLTTRYHASGIGMSVLVESGHDGEKMIFDDFSGGVAANGSLEDLRGELCRCLTNVRNAS